MLYAMYRSSYSNTMFTKQEKAYIRTFHGPPSPPVAPVRTTGTPRLAPKERSALSPETVATLATPVGVRSSSGAGVHLPRFVLALRVTLLHSARVKRAAYIAPRALHFSLGGVLFDDESGEVEGEGPLSPRSIAVSVPGAGDADAAYTHAVATLTQAVIACRCGSVYVRVA